LSEYNNLTGQSVCTSCPSEMITRFEGSSSLYNCVCPSGRYGAFGIGPCRLCPEWKGIRCEVNSTVPFVLRGFWRSDARADLVQQCFPDFACPYEGFGRDSQCAEKFEGTRCGACAENYFKSGQDCVSCPAAWITWLILSICFIAFFSAFVWHLVHPLNHSQRSRFHLRSILVSFQSLGVLSRFTEPSGQSSSLSLFLGILDLSNLNFDVFFSMDCVFLGSFWAGFSFKIFSLYLSVGFMLGLGYFLSRFFKTGASQASYFDKSSSAVLIFASSLHTFGLSTAFSAFRCFPQEDGSYTLLSSPSMDCYDSLWYANSWAIVLGIASVFILPIFLSRVLYVNFGKTNHNIFHWRYGHLVNKYRQKYYYWEVVQLLWKTLFVCIVDLTNSWSKFERSFLLVVYFLLCICVESVVRAYDKNHLFIFEMRSVYVFSMFEIHA
jgi:hypothetical protein